MHSRTLNALSGKSLKYVQEENSNLTYVINWAGLLNADTVSSSTWTTEDTGLTIAGESNTTKTASARLSGDPGRYRAVNKIVTANGDTQERYIDVTIKDNSSGYVTDYGMGR